MLDIYVRTDGRWAVAILGKRGSGKAFQKR
jgi:hypothetical protein